MKNLQEKLSGLKSATTNSVLKFTELCELNRFKKGTLIKTYPPTASAAFFMEEGIVQSVFKSSQDEMTAYLITNNFLLPISLFDGKNSAIDYIEFLTDASVWVINLNQIKVLIKEEPEVSLLLLEIFEEIVIAGNEREKMLRMKNVNERYLYLLGQNKSLVYGLCNDILASYLNVTPKYLFTIKKNNRRA